MISTAGQRILVADDDHALARTLSWILRENGYEVITVPDAEELIDRLDAEQPDLLLLDIMMPRVDGLQLLERIKGDPRKRDLPVLMISSMPPEEATVRALGLGASDFIAKPFRVRELLARIKAHLRVRHELDTARSLVRTRHELVAIVQELTASLRTDEVFQILARKVARALKIGQCSVLTVDVTSGTATVMAAADNPLLSELRVDLRNYPELEAALQSERPVFVADVVTDPIFETIRSRWTNEGQFVPTRSVVAAAFRPRGHAPGLLFLRSAQDEAALNARDAQFVEEVLRAAVPAIEKAYDLQAARLDSAQFRALAETDALTGTYNRRALDERLGAELERAGRYNSKLAILMLDIDEFKKVNDTFGHRAGDQVLCQLATILKRELRGVDLVARYGGEEFVVVLPETNLQGARNFAERILKRVAEHDFGADGTPVHVTISVGVATYPEVSTTVADDFLSYADQRLYQAKREGRNRYRD
jgi:two-component system cell cycle response regulator